MIKTTSVLAVMILFIVLAIPVAAGWDSCMGSQPATDFAKIMHDYNVITTDPRDIIVALFNIKKSDIQIVEQNINAENIMYCEWLQIWAYKIETAEEAAEYHKGKTLKVYYYDFAGDNETIYDADIKLFFTSEADKKDYDSQSVIHINKEALEHIEKDMRDLLDTINTPQMLFNVCDVEVPEEYYDIDAYHKSVQHSEFNEILGNNFWIINGCAENASFNYITRKVSLSSCADTPANDCTYLLSPYTAKILRAFNGQFYRVGKDKTYGYDFYEGSQKYEMTVNYAAPEGVCEDEYLSYTIDSIAVEVRIDMDLDKVSAPQTGFATYAYAAVAVVAAAGAVALLKRRRKSV